MKSYAIVNLYNMYNTGELMQLLALRKALPKNDKVTLISFYSFVNKEACSNNNIEYAGKEQPDASYIKMAITFFSIIIQAILFKLGISRKNNILKALHNSDIVLDMGGDTFSDNVSILYTITHSIPLLVCIIINKPYIVFSQSLGIYKTLVTKVLAKLLLKKAKLITARENYTIEYLRDIGISSNIIAMPDIAYLYKNSNCNNSKLYDIGILTSSLCKKQSGITEEQNLHLLTIIAKYYSDRGYKVLLIPHVYTPARNMGANKKLNDITMAISIACNVDRCDIKSPGSIASVKVVIGSRMHGCVNALNHNTPVIALSYSHKFTMLQGANEIINLKGANINSIITACNKILTEAKW